MSKARFVYGANAESFAEVSIAAPSAAVHGEALPLPVEPHFDAVRTRFSDMRHIARQGSWYNMSNEEVFYEQARFMEDFEDDFEDTVPLLRYYPCYQKLGNEQLRTYFTWRADVRSGVVRNVSPSYVFMYLYELLNNVGTTDPQKALDEIMSLWGTFRKYNAVIDRYVLSWLKDYHVYYPLDESFIDFASRNHLEASYPTVFCFESDAETSFEVFSSLSSYDVHSSIFYTEDTAPLIRDCFFFVLSRLREAFNDKKRNFEDYLFYTRRQKSKWTPFAKAIFFPVFDQPDRVVRLSKREVYECKEQIWTGSSVMVTDQGRQLVGYVMKEMESRLRKAEKFKYSIKASLDSCKAVDQERLAKVGVSIPGVVAHACNDFYQQRSWKPVVVNLNKLGHIRDDALTTQNKLIITEKDADTSLSLSDASSTLPSPVGAVSASLAPVASVGVPSVPQITDVPAQISEHEELGGWAGFAGALTNIEVGAIRLVLGHGCLKTYAQKHHLMLEVLVDGINQKAVDCIGDAVFEIDDEEALIYDEYRRPLEEAIGI